MFLELTDLEDPTRIFSGELTDGLVIGRGWDAGINLYDDQYTARKNSRILCREDKYYIEDFYSTNHTRFNGRILKPRQPVLLTDGMTLGVGVHEYRVRITKEERGDKTMSSIDSTETDEMQNVEKMRGEREPYRDKIRGCLLGGAAGDALGYPIEFMKEDAIWNEYGQSGITAYEPDRRKGKALISDDTQMTLFTANGILAGDTRGCLQGIEGEPAEYVYEAYQEWLETQNLYDIAKIKKGKQRTCWLMDVPELYATRVPGNTCISALEELKNYGKDAYMYVNRKRNDSKGNGGLMRVAPMALARHGAETLDAVDREGGELARLTHCHTLGYMPAAFLVHVINRIVYPQSEMSLEDIILEAKETVGRIYKGEDHLTELLDIVDQALTLAGNRDDDVTNIHRIGAGWVAEQTLGIALYCALRYRDDFSGGIIAAVNHSGDSDTTGAVAGNILGALCGYEAIEQKWKENLELSDIILEIADDLCYGCMMEEYGSYRDPVWSRKYVEGRR